MRGYSKGIVMEVSTEESDADGNEYIVVWAPRFPLKELLFPRGYSEFNPGDFVYFKLTSMIGQSQSRIQHTELIPAETPPNIEVIRRSLSPFQVQLQISIPPRDSSYFDELTFATLDYGVIFYCFSPPFGKIVSFIPLEELDASYGKFYIAKIERVLKSYDWLIEKMGTMFNLSEQKLVEIDDPLEIQRLSTLTPWYQPLEQPQPQSQSGIVVETPNTSLVQSNDNAETPVIQSNANAEVGHSQSGIVVETPNTSLVQSNDNAETPVIQSNANAEVGSTVKNALSKMISSNIFEALNMQLEYFTMCNATRRNVCSAKYVGQADCGKDSQ